MGFLRFTKKLLTSIPPRKSKKKIIFKEERKL